MRGRYYLKHTINHTVDNQYKIKQLNENYKSMIIKNAIDYLKTTSDDIDKKVMYLKSLTHNVYRYGTKYKYECNLSSLEISNIIRSVYDDKLHYAYFGKTIKEYDNVYTAVLLTGIGFILFVFIFLLIIKACST